MKSPTKKILLADDHDVVRKGLRETLEEEFGQVAFGDAKDGLKALEQIRMQQWDLVLLDINMDGLNGFEVLQQIQQTPAAPPVLILSMYPEEEFAVRALMLGAAGYISKGRASEELVSAVKMVLTGERYISPAVADRLAAHLHRKSEQQLPELRPAHISQPADSAFGL